MKKKKWMHKMNKKFKSLIIIELRKKEMSLLQDNAEPLAGRGFSFYRTQHFSLAILFPVAGSADQLEKYKDLVPCKKKET